MKTLRFVHAPYNPKIIGNIIKLCKIQVHLFLWRYKSNENENEAEYEKIDQRYDINRPTSRYEPKYTKYIMYLSIITGICIKQHLSNIWSSIHEKVKQHRIAL